MKKNNNKFYEGAKIGPWILIKEIEKKNTNRKYEVRDKVGNTAYLWTSYLSLISSDFMDEDRFDYFSKMVLQIAKNLKKRKDKQTQHGSLGFLLFGEESSTQSLLIRFGNEYEIVLNEFAILCGKKQHIQKNQLLNGKQLDSLFITENPLPVINYFEQKTNAQLDSEKLPATANKIKQIVKNLQDDTDIKVEGNLLWTTVFELEGYPKNIHNTFKNFKNKGVEIKFMKDYFNFCGLNVTRMEFESLFRKVGDILK